MILNNNTSNTKVIKSLRRYESFYLNNFKRCEEQKKLYFKRDSENWNKLRSFILESDTDYITYILKEGFRIRPEVMKEYAKRNQINKLFDTFQLPSNILRKIVNSPSFDSLIMEERFYINQLVIMHYPMVVLLVTKSTKKSQFLSNYFTEIYNEGIFGIIHTLHKFENNHGAAFSTYAYKWIQYYIHRYINSLIKDINFVNGNTNKHLFIKNNVIESYDDYVKSFMNSKIDFLLEFPKLDCLSEKTLHSNFNKLISNNKSRNHLITLCKSLSCPHINKIFTYKLESKILARLLLEVLLDIKKSNIETLTDNSNTINLLNSKEAELSNDYSDFEYKETLTKILQTVDINAKDDFLIQEFLKKGEVPKGYNINSVIKKIQTQLKESGVEALDHLS